MVPGCCPITYTANSWQCCFNLAVSEAGSSSHCCNSGWGGKQCACAICQWARCLAVITGNCNSGNCTAIDPVVAGDRELDHGSQSPLLTLRVSRLCVPY